MPDYRLRFRDEWDSQIIGSIIGHDEYRLRPLAESGFRPTWIVDIGAHIGIFTTFAKSLWPDSRVIAVEPGLTNAAVFTVNAENLTDVILHQCAIGPINGPSLIDLIPAPDGNNAAGTTHEIGDQTTEAVSAIDIRGLLRAYGNPSIDILKLDAEGPEGIALDELHRAGYLPRIRYICGEWHGKSNIPLIRAALAETHDLELYEHDWEWGAFFAHRR